MSNTGATPTPYPPPVDYWKPPVSVHVEFTYSYPPNNALEGMRDKDGNAADGKDLEWLSDNLLE